MSVSHRLPVATLYHVTLSDPTEELYHEVVRWLNETTRDWRVGLQVNYMVFSCHPDPTVDDKQKTGRYTATTPQAIFQVSESTLIMMKLRFNE
jgi:hypothetical protein